MLVVSRFRYGVADAERAVGDLTTCLDGLGEHPGFVGGSIGRALDDQEIWVLVTAWADVGSYRRALSSYDVKLSVVPLLSRALDEPSAYEEVVGERRTVLNDPKPRGS